MPYYLISFDWHAMDHIPESEMPTVAKDAHAVVQEIIDAGVYVMAGGVADEPSIVVAVDGSVSAGPHPDAIGGATVVDVPSRVEAIAWAAKIAVACRCAQEVRQIGPDAKQEAMLDAARGE